MLIKKKAIIKVKNNDGRCFEYSILAAFRLQEGNIIHHLELVQGYGPYLGKLKAVTSDMKVQVIPKFEKQNNFAISVYTVKEKEKTIYPLYITKMRNKPPIQLLLIEGDGRNHYTYIRNLNRLLSTRTEDPKLFCPYCCYGFCKRYNVEKNLEKHIETCEVYGPQRTEVLKEEDEFIEFNDHEI